MLILLLLFCNNNGNGGNVRCENNGGGSFDGPTPFNAFNNGAQCRCCRCGHDFRDGCYCECDLRNMTTPYQHAQSSACDLEFVIIIILFFFFKQINGPIAAVPLSAETRARQNPFYEPFDNNFCCP